MTEPDGIRAIASRDDMTEQDRIADIEAAIQRTNEPASEKEAAALPVEPAKPAESGEAETVGDQGAPAEAGKPAGELSELEKAEHAFRRKANKLTRRVGERDMRIAELEERLQQQFQQVPQKPVETSGNNGEKTLEDFDYDQTAYLRYLAKEEARTQLVERDQIAERDKRQQAFAEKVSAFIAEHPDYEAIVSQPHVPLTMQVSSVIYETDNPPAVAFYLAQHLDEATAIAQMHPIQMARAIGRIEASLSAPPAQTPPSPPRAVTSAPAVAPTVRGTSTSTSNVEAWGVADHIAAIRAQQT